ncbi:hypothetical protein ABB37_08672 [Leptomonas pyrrhocoris]|uniref:Uncharacterized protein n=1 Tax=Leptomonas pyrrhocoris TaxID=157538 RepID=A0A0M9FSV6_LEPPY|nr:hypothetical protein ABB37_08672 [Leptomonas pyrrhocoris]KPA75400.1 hypothetical protein ABB37_08672 [Leptomonas pyrrhocoris]|eukprot:XP_015653839.1 hypothetical protein ABB37_08672 [Leptomonas pyrrhocoris]
MNLQFPIKFVEMRAASRVLQHASLAAPVIEDGQESMKKLVYAPLGFLSLGGNASYIASILASAVSFLEGYSVEDLETDVRLVQNSNGEYTAHTKLTLVPYALPRQDALIDAASIQPLGAATDLTLPKVTHYFSMSRTLPVRRQEVSSTLELDRFRDSFYGNVMSADIVANDILLTTDSVEVANAVLRYSAQVGLTIPRSTLSELMRRMKTCENSLVHHVFKELEFEVNLGMMQQTSLFTSRSTVSDVPPPRKRKQSKLERLRSSSSRCSKT